MLLLLVLLQSVENTKIIIIKRVYILLHAALFLFSAVNSCVIRLLNITVIYKGNQDGYIAEQDTISLMLLGFALAPKLV